MSKLITYALFEGKAEPHELAAYVRGFYLNARMNNFLYPDFRTHLEVDQATYDDYKNLFDWLVENNTLSLNIDPETPPLCEGMLRRMKPIFTIDVSHIICRDCDAITTHREAQTVQSWLEGGFGFHAINDDPAHGGLMGGMVGFDSAKFKAVTGLHSFEQMIEGRDLSQHGSDQHLLNALHPKLHPHLHVHILKGGSCNGARVDQDVSVILPNVDHALWESDLTCRHIGSAGVVIDETLRFFRRHDEYNWKFQLIEKEFKHLFYWQT